MAKNHQPVLVQIPRWWHWHRLGKPRTSEALPATHGGTWLGPSLKFFCEGDVPWKSKVSISLIHIIIYIYKLAYTIIYIYTTLVCMYTHIYIWSFIILQFFAASCSSVRKARTPAEVKRSCANGSCKAIRWASSAWWTSAWKSGDFHGLPWPYLISEGYPAWSTYKKLMGKSPFFGVKFHYKWWFSIVMFNYQRVHGF